ncbi:MAG: serine hydrolase [Gaiellaceae bacterium]
MIAAAVLAVAVAVAGEPAIPKADEAFFGRVVAKAPAGATQAALFVGGRRIATKPVLGPKVSFSVRRSPARYEVRIRFDRGATVAAPRAWLLPSSAGQALPRRSRDGALAARLAELGRSYDGWAGLWVHDLRTGSAAGWNSDTPFPAASVVKLAVLIAALDRWGPRPERSDAWRDIWNMTTWSANDSTNRLVARLGGPGVIQGVLHRVGATSSTYTGDYRLGTSVAADTPKPLPVLTYRRTTARDAGRILYVLQAAALGQPDAARRTRLSRHEARVGLALLLSSSRTGDNAGVLRPPGPAAQKHGWTNTVRHTAAIVYTATGPKIVVVLTYRPDAVRLSASVELGARVLRAAGVVRPAW